MIGALHMLLDHWLLIVARWVDCAVARLVCGCFGELVEEDHP